MTSVFDSHLVEYGRKITIAGTARQIHTILIRGGCDGSPNCALEIYAAKGSDYLATDGINLHVNDAELEAIYQAVKTVRKYRKRITGDNHTHHPYCGCPAGTADSEGRI